VVVQGKTQSIDIRWLPGSYPGPGRVNDFETTGFRI